MDDTPTRPHDTPSGPGREGRPPPPWPPQMHNNDDGGHYHHHRCEHLLAGWMGDGGETRGGETGGARKTMTRAGREDDATHLTKLVEWKGGAT